MVVVFGEADLAAPLVALGAAGAWFVHADRGHKVKRIDLIARASSSFLKIVPIIDTLKAAQARGTSFWIGPEGSVRSGVVAFEKQQSTA